MFDIILGIGTQALLFLPLAIGITISYNMLRATDMTIDGSFVLGAAVFGKLISIGYAPYIGLICAMLSGACAGLFTACIQRQHKIDALLAGILAAFILSSINLSVMGKPNINLLTEPTLFSQGFAQSELYGWFLVSVYTAIFCCIIFLILRSRLGLLLRAFGCNPQLLQQQGYAVENYRMFGFALSNVCAATAGCFTAQAIGYADVGMGLGVTLTAIGAIILGQQLFAKFYKKHFRLYAEFAACLLGVSVYFSVLTMLLQLNIDPVYLKMLLGLMLIGFLRVAKTSSKRLAVS